MRALILSISILAVTACTTGDETVGSKTQSIWGGTADFDHTSVVAVAVDIGDGWGHVCSGTLIAADIVLTAGHCFYPGDVAAVTFAQDIAPGWPIDASVEMHTGSYIVHPDFMTNGSNGQQEDMAVILLDEPVAIAPMPLAAAGSAESIAHKELVTIVGYGMESATGLGSAGNNSWTDERRAATSALKAVNNELVHSNSNLGGNGGACFGDSGGATLANIGGQEVLVGVTIIGDGSCVQLMQAARTETVIARDFLGDFVALP